MGFIGSCFVKLEGWMESFSLEVFAGVLEPAWIDEALAQANRQSRRRRKLPASLTVWLVIAMGFYRHLSIENILVRLGNVLGMGSVWDGGHPPESSSTVEARDRLGFTTLRLLLARLWAWVRERHSAAMSWKGYLLLALDGTTFKVFDSEANRKYFGLPGASRGRAAFPQMRALFLVSTKLHVVIESLFAPYRRAEIKQAYRMLQSIPMGSLVLLDRNFCAWRFLYDLQSNGSHFLVRAKSNMNGQVRSVLGRGDALVEMKIHSALRREFPHLPRTVVVREITARIDGKPYRFFTSLLDADAVTAAELVALYASRWEEELMLDEIQTHQCGLTTVNRPVIFRCKSPRRVMQEAFGLVLAYNLVRSLMAEAGRRFALAPVRISFIGSLERIRDAALVMSAAPTRRLPAIFNDLLRSISRAMLPKRRKRKNPRAVCIKMSNYPLKRKAA